MNLRELVRHTQVKGVRGTVDREIHGLAYDSRRVGAGDLFICIEGQRYDGHDFLPQAREEGAVAAVVERYIGGVTPGLAQILVEDSRLALAHLAAAFYSFPSRRLDLIGVTGTNGKTTTTYLVESLLNSAGYGTGLIGTIEDKILDRGLETVRTTPEALELNRLLARMIEEGVEAAVMEVSSHAVDLKRTTGTVFKCGIFTNITRDHLDYHETFQDYLDCKLRFLRQVGEGPGSGFVVLNSDDPHAPYILGRLNSQVITFGLDSEAGVAARGVELSRTGASFALVTPKGELPVSLRLTGKFNVYNALAAAAFGVGYGLDLETVREGLEGVSGVAGRFEVVDCGQDFGVIVDYAHTPDGLKNILNAAGEFESKRVIVVFGCGGDRDREKRPMMGRVAAEYADYCIVTSDNPRNEEPMEIIRQIEAGFSEARSETPYEIVEDRRQAIHRAVSLAEREDLILIVGKGHETQQEFRDRVVPFDDRRVAREALNSRMEGS